MRLRQMILTAAMVSAVSIGTATASWCQTAFSVNYDFTGAAGTQASTPITANSFGSSVTFSAFTRGSGIAATGAANSINSNGFTTNGTLSDAIANSDYYSFFVNPTSGNSVSISSFSFGSQRSGTGPANLVFRSSADNFGNDLATAAAPTTNAVQTVNLTNSPNLTASTEFRIYAYGSTGAGGTLRIGDNTANGDQFVINGTFQPVPAPPAAISLAIGGLVGLVGTGANKLRHRSGKRKQVIK